MVQASLPRYPYADHILLELTPLGGRPVYGDEAEDCVFNEARSRCLESTARSCLFVSDREQAWFRTAGLEQLVDVARAALMWPKTGRPPHCILTNPFRRWFGQGIERPHGFAVLVVYLPVPGSEAASLLAHASCHAANSDGLIR